MNGFAVEEQKEHDMYFVNIDKLRNEDCRKDIRYFVLFKQEDDISVSVYCRLKDQGCILINNRKIVIYSDIDEAIKTIREEYGCYEHKFLLSHQPM